jgi:hypothetical protein
LIGISDKPENMDETLIGGSSPPFRGETERGVGEGIREENRV